MVGEWTVGQASKTQPPRFLKGCTSCQKDASLVAHGCPPTRGAQQLEAVPDLGTGGGGAAHLLLNLCSKHSRGAGARCSGRGGFQRIQSWGRRNSDAIPLAASGAGGTVTLRHAQARTSGRDAPHARPPTHPPSHPPSHHPATIQPSIHPAIHPTIHPSFHPHPPTLGQLVGVSLHQVIHAAHAAAM